MPSEASVPRPLVGWYVHHHGAGHVTRFLAMRPELDADVVVFSSMPPPASLPYATEWVQLSRDDDLILRADGSTLAPSDGSPTAHGLLHWAPLGHPGHQNRLASIAQWIAGHPFAAFVVDVSVEVTLLVRLLGVAPVVISQPGDRSDEPHRLAYEAAERIIAPWPAGVLRTPLLDRVSDRVTHVGGISRFDGRVDLQADGTSPTPGRVLFLGGGASGSGVAAEQVAAASRATPHHEWSTLGIDGWTDDPWPELAAAEIVVSAAGQNSIADLAAAGARAVVIAQPRPFGEQASMAAALGERSLATVLDEWPADDEWAGVLENARVLQPDWSSWRVSGAAQRAADVIAGVAAEHRQ